VNESLKAESEKLARSWMQHDAEKLRDYLVASVEDPRLNLQSVFSRHFLLRAVVPGRFETLMEQECRFAAVMNWLTSLAQGIGEHEFFMHSSAAPTTPRGSKSRILSFRLSLVSHVAPTALLFLIISKAFSRAPKPARNSREWMNPL